MKIDSVQYRYARDEIEREEIEQKKSDMST